MIRKTAVIIGASSDIGQKTALLFAENGYNLALTYNNTKFGVKPKKDVKIKYYKLNLTDKGKVEGFFREVENDFESLDVLVFASGVAQKRALIIDCKDEEIDNLFEVNIKAAIKCVKSFCKRTVNVRNASVVLIGSFAEKIGCSCESVYAATKSAMSGLCKSLASELGNLGVRINVVAPGFIDTKMNNNLTQEEKDEIADMTPLQRLGSTEDVAEAVYFLASDKASFITGQTLFVDGGLVLE